MGGAPLMVIRSLGRVSPLERMPPGIKLTLSLVVGCGLVAISDIRITVLGSALALFLHFLAGKSPWRTARETWHLLPFLAFLAMVTGLFHGIVESVIFFWRFTLLLWITHLLASSTTSAETMRFMEKVLGILPLGRLGWSSRDLAILFLMAVRFFFFFRKEIALLRKAQKARAFNIKGLSIEQRFRYLLSMGIALLDSAARLSHRVTLVLRAKAYSPGPSPYHLARKPSYELRPKGACHNPQHETDSEGQGAQKNPLHGHVWGDSLDHE